MGYEVEKMFTEPQLVFTNQPKDTRFEGKSNHGSQVMSVMKRSKGCVYHFRGRNDIKLRVQQRSALDKLYAEIKHATPILNNAVKRINFVRSIMVKNCNNLQLTYTRLERLRLLLSNNSSSLSTQTAAALTQSIQSARDQSAEALCALTDKTLP